MKLYTNWFSPFARKVALALDFKGLDYDAVDGLSRENHDALWAVNPRGEVPTLCDGDLVVTQSAHILAYLEDAYPERAIYPTNPADRALARRLEHLFDTRVDALLVDCSLWHWAERDDTIPEGLMEAAQADLNAAFVEVEQAFEGHIGPFFFGDSPGVVEFALWPHLVSVWSLGLDLDKDRYPHVADWFSRLRRDPLFVNDARRTKAFMASDAFGTLERRKIAWRGDRLEWILARGFHEWFFNEIREDRVIWPVHPLDRKASHADG